MLEEGSIKSGFSSTSFFLSSRWTPLEVSQRPCGVNVFSTLLYRVLGKRRWAGWGVVERNDTAAGLGQLQVLPET